MVKKFAVKTLTKSCDLDPLPASVLKICFPIILPTLTSIINMSLKNGVMPNALKAAVLKPLLKKKDADFEQLQNFPPNLKSNICVQANREGCCFVIKRPNTEVPSQHFTVLKRPSLDFTMIFLLLLITIKPLFYFYSTYLLPLIL